MDASPSVSGLGPRPGEERASRPVGALATCIAAVALLPAAACGGDPECVTSLDCPSGLRCVAGECTGGGRDAGDADGGPRPCATAGECDDGVACTRDRCQEGSCENVPDDGACTASPDGRCVAGVGCAYGACSPASCAAGPCQTARCDGELCVLESTCRADQECCAGTCVARGCDDGDACTDDACGAAGCEHVPGTGACDDGLYCNGADSCAGGTCTVHAGDPCGASTTCDEATDACLDCGSDVDCPPPSLGPWSACTFPDDPCAQTGARQRTVTTFACVSSRCVGTSRVDTEPCARATDGVTCGPTSYGAYSACGGFMNDCDETGTRSRARFDQRCAGGACRMATSVESETCGRVTDGWSCDDWASCDSGICAAGVCSIRSSCSPPRICCEPGVCIFGGECP